MLSCAKNCYNNHFYQSLLTALALSTKAVRISGPSLWNSFRIEFNMATLMFKALNVSAPPYLAYDCKLISDYIC